MCKNCSYNKSFCSIDSVHRKDGAWGWPKIQVRRMLDTIAERERYIQQVSHRGISRQLQKKFATLKQLEIMGRHPATPLARTNRNHYSPNYFLQSLIRITSVKFIITLAN